MKSIFESGKNLVVKILTKKCDQNKSASSTIATKSCDNGIQQLRNFTQNIKRARHDLKSIEEKT